MENRAIYAVYYKCDYGNDDAGLYSAITDGKCRFFLYEDNMLEYIEKTLDNFPVGNSVVVRKLQLQQDGKCEYKLAMKRVECE